MINDIFKSSINYVSTNTNSRKINDNKEVKQTSKNDQTNKTENVNDKYDKPMTNAERKMQIAYMTNQAELQTKNFERLVSSIFSKQSNKAGLINMDQNGNLKNFYKNLTVDAKTIAKAKEDISEDGYYGVKQTPDRILSFAKKDSR